MMLKCKLMLFRFRANVDHAAIAARLPLDDSDDGDSVLSGSSESQPASRRGSSSDVRPTARKISPGLRRQNSTEVSGTAG